MLHTKFQTSGPGGSEEEYFSIYFYAFLWFEPRTPGAGPPWFGLNKLGKGPPRMLHTKFQASEPSSSGEEDF